MMLEDFNKRDPLILAYEALKAALKAVHGEDFAVFDDLPDSTEFQKKRDRIPAANISLVSGGCDKAFMREFVPHKILKAGKGKFKVLTETMRFEYFIQVSFFAAKKGLAQRLSTEFYTAMEIENEIYLPGDPLGETMQLLLKGPPTQPKGKPDLYQCDQTWICRGRLLTDDIVNAVDVRSFRVRIENR